MRLRNIFPVLAALALLGGLSRPAAAQRFTISGYDTLTFRKDSITGGPAGQQAYTYGNYERQNAIENNAGLNIAGEILPRVSLNATINSNRYSPDQSRYNLEYKGQGLGITVGDINAALSGNEFAPLNKSLRGMKVDALLGSLNLTTLLSQERAQVHTDSFQGNNSAGPYQLKYSPILDGTEQVRVDGQLKKLGVDYTLEYNTGILYFQSTMLIPATSLIEVSYEYAGYGQNPGLLTGMRGELPLGKAGRIGATYLAQTSRVGSSTAASLQRTDRFIGENRPMELQLQYRPVKKINLITVDGVPQTEGKDYTVTSLSAGVISFLKIVPAPAGLATDAAANVIVEYEVDNSDSASSGGNRSILGLDGSFNLGKTSIIGIQFAHSSSATSSGGNALSLRGNTNLGNLSLSFNLRDISSTFSAIESVGFQQRERAIDGNLEYKPVEHIRLTASMSSSKRPYTSYAGSTSGDAVEKMLNALQNSFAVTFDYPSLPRLEFGHQRYRTSGSSTDTASAITNMRLQYSPFNGFNFSANLDHTANNDYSSLGGSATSFTQRYNASYTPGSRFSVQADFTSSNLHSRTLSAATATTSSESSSESNVTATNSANRATSGNLTMTYSPFSFATLTASYRVADSGSGVGGFSNGYYSSSYSSGSYLSTGSYSVGNSYTGDYYSSYSSGSSLYNSSSYSSYTSSKLAALMRSRETTDTTDANSSTATTTDTDSTRIRNISRSIGLQLNPLERLNLSFTFGHDLQEGVLTGSNSVSTNVAMAFNYTPLNLVSLNGQLTRQRYTFISAGGNSSSNIAALGAQIGPWNKLTLAMNLQSMTSDTGLSTTSATTTDTASALAGSYKTRLNTLTSRLDYPLSQSKKLFTELQLSRTKGGTAGTGSTPEDSQRLSAGLGIEFLLNKFLSYTMNLQRINYSDRGDPTRNYQGNLMTGEMKARF